eukprot:3462725-Heterocapsa_arctica.AAC.1
MCDKLKKFAPMWKDIQMCQEVRADVQDPVDCVFACGRDHQQHEGGGSSEGPALQAPGPEADGTRHDDGRDG